MDDIRKNMRDIRRNFEYGTLSRAELPTNPIELLKEWLEAAVELKVKDANAFVLATAVNNQPNSRVVLIRDITENALHFYTNYGSEKAAELATNELAAVNIFWPDLDRQIRMKVRVEKLTAELSDDYFKTRPRASQIGAWASQQSSELENRQRLEDRVKEYEEQFEGQEVPRPEFWGGYALIPSFYEFWQGRPNRLHDRFIYKRDNDTNWEIKRLYP